MPYCGFVSANLRQQGFSNSQKFAANLLFFSVPSSWGRAWFISVICVNQWSDFSLLVSIRVYPRKSAVGFLVLVHQL